MSKLTLLAIDDEVSNLKLLSSFLKDDYHVLVAKSGAWGIQTAADAQPDLILLDVLMPEMDGFDVLKKLQSTSSTQDIPVMFITGLTSTDNEEYGLTLGAVDYIYKPFSPAVVKARVATHVKIIEQKRTLLQLTEQATQAYKAKSQFLANMSHEIRTPLTTVIGFADGLLSGDIKESERVRAINTIASSGKHLLALINDILDYSKIETGLLAIENITFDLHDLLYQVQQMCFEIIKTKPIEFDIQFIQKIPRFIKSDPTRLQQILLNLLSNAIKFTEKGQVCLMVSYDQSSLQFVVKDTGIGIADHKITELFGAFFQADASTSRQFGGTGLGLSISKNLANALGGDIAVNSMLGEGSEFALSIELDIDVSKPDMFDAISSKEISDLQQGNLESKIEGRVLLAEDHPENRQLLTLVLQSLGLSVDAVSNGKEAVEAALENDYQLVLMDIQMPEMDGCQALETLMQLGYDVPIVALTADVIEAHVQSFIGRGFVDHCAKPINKQELIQKVSQYIQVAEPRTVDPEAFEALKAQFSESFTQYINRIQHVKIDKELNALVAIAHELKGAAGSFEYRTLSHVATELENNIIKITEQLSRLEQLLKDT